MPTTAVCKTVPKGSEVKARGALPSTSTKFATLADMVIAVSWSDIEVGSIPTGWTIMVDSSTNGAIIYIYKAQDEQVLNI